MYPAATVVLFSAVGGLILCGAAATLLVAVVVVARALGRAGAAGVDEAAVASPARGYDVLEIIRQSTMPAARLVRDRGLADSPELHRAVAAGEYDWLVAAQADYDAALAEERDRSRREIEQLAERAYLYEVYDGDGRLLYIGLSDEGGPGLADLVRSKPWTDDTIDWRICQTYESRQEAVAAERRLIRERRPRYNIEFPGCTPRRP